MLLYIFLKSSLNNLIPQYLEKCQKISVRPSHDSFEVHFEIIFNFSFKIYPQINLPENILKYFRISSEFSNFFQNFPSFLQFFVFNDMFSKTITYLQFLGSRIFINYFIAGQEVITRDCLSSIKGIRTDIPADHYEGCRPATVDVKLANYVNNSIKEIDIKR